MAPEPFGHLGDGVDSEAVYVVFVDHVADPVKSGGSDVVVFLLEIGQTGQSAVFDSALVMVGEVCVGDVAPVMEVAGIVEGVIDTEVHVSVAHVVGDYIYHDPDSSFVAGIDHVDEILF